jgi:D-alanyl-D-alanine carboxypeptidase
MRFAAVSRLLASVGLVAVLLIGGCSGGSSEEAPDTTTTPSATGTSGPTSTPTPTPPPTPESTPSPFAGDPLLRVVDRDHPLEPEFVPDHLVPIPGRWNFDGRDLRLIEEAADALDRMLAAANESGHEILVRSAYRSYATQQATFAFWVEQLGEERARRESAEAGFSEHQLGVTVDLTAASVGWELIPAFGDTAEGQWLRANAGRYGFALSYPEEGEPVTGYIFEPWHYRYIGPAAAAAFEESGLILVQWLLLAGGEDG